MCESIPEGWIAGTFGDFLVQRKEVGHAGDELLSVTSGRGVILQSESGRRDISSDDKSAYRRVLPGDIVYNTMRMWQGVSGASSYTGIVSPAYTVCAPSPDVDPIFLSYLIKHPGYVNSFLLMSQGLVSDTWNLRFSKFANVSVALPPLAEQQRIAEVLEALDEASHSCEVAIAKSELTRWAVAQEKLGRPPIDSWSRGRVADFGEVRMGRQRSPKHESGASMTPYLRVANVFDGRIDYTDVLSMNFSLQEREVFGLNPGDILLNEGQSLDLVGRSAIYQGPPREYCYQNTLIRYRCADLLLPEFAQLKFSSWLRLGYFSRVAFQTTSIAHLGADRFAQMEMSFPPLEEQCRIVSIIGAHDERIAAERARLEKLRKLKAGLMDDLLTGRVRVNQLKDLPV
ncbi:restriction endonuclease subunit S [Nocardiopsis terrae]